MKQLCKPAEGAPQVAAGENPLARATDNNQGRESTQEWGVKRRRRFTPTLCCAYALSLLLSGCTLGLVHKPAPQGWPRGDKMHVTVTEKPLWTTHMECSFSQSSAEGALLFLLAPHLACAHINLSETCDTGTCNIVVSGEALIEHERMHCAGMDHIGSSVIEDYFQACLDKLNTLPKVE